MLKTSEVRIGAPDQKTTGAIKHAPVGTELPDLSKIKAAEVTLDPQFKGDEYVSEDGLTLTPSMSTSDIKEWSGTTVRRVLESFDGTISWTMLSTNANSLGIAFGSKYVESQEASSDHGAQVGVKLGAHLPEPQSWVFLMKDGDARMVIVVPNGQVTEVGEVTFSAKEAVAWEVTLSCYPDEKGECIYIYTDDGQVSEAA